MWKDPKERLSFLKIRGKGVIMAFSNKMLVLSVSVKNFINHYKFLRMFACRDDLAVTTPLMIKIIEAEKNCDICSIYSIVR